MRFPGSPITRSGRLGTLARRIAFFALVAGATAVATSLMMQILDAGGLTPIGMAILVLFTITFAWIATSFWTAAMGFVVRLVGGDPMSLAAADPAAPLRTRTAIVMPVYNEAPGRVIAGLEASLRGLIASRDAVNFDAFLLSDTTDPAIARAERAAFAGLRRRLGPAIGLYYRRRERNLERKAGNIADFCSRWGGAYDHMIVLDADSVMRGATLIALARLMEARPETGIIQTVPVPTGRETVFARIQQFAGRLYGPSLAAGLAFWQLGDANYWGHNAIIRIAAFAAHCGLPVLPGRAPLGGEILSHDFVEAALMRRAGWKVWLVPDLEGSYEELPANVIDYAKRDRRWCQGNLQHGNLLNLPGLHWLSRVHLVMGITSYVASPLWLLLLVLSSADFISKALIGPVYFKPGFNLFPDWPVAKTGQIELLLTMTLAVLLLPRLFGLALVIASRSRRRLYGGFRALLASAGLEILFSTLLAPVMMLFQSNFVIVTLAGGSIAWEAQPRDDRGVSWAESARRMLPHTLLGAAWGALVLALAPQYIWWLAPVLAGLVAAIPLCRWSSRIDLGRKLRARGLFLTPEETAPPAELRQLRAAIAAGNAAGVALDSLGEPTLPVEAPCLMPKQSLAAAARGLSGPVPQRSRAPAA
jgi:membrane glycosyltransferase